MNWLPEVISHLEHYPQLAPFVQQLSDVCDESAPRSPRPTVVEDEEQGTIAIGWQEDGKILALVCDKNRIPWLHLVHGNQNRFVSPIDPATLTLAIQSYWQST